MTRVVEGRTHRLSLEPDVLSEAADWMDRQRALWGRLFDVVDDYLKEESRNEYPTDRVAAGVERRPRRTAGEGEGADPRPRRAGGRAPPDAVDGGGEGVHVRRPGRRGEPARPVRRPPPADRLPRLLRAGRHHLPGVGRRVPGAGLRRLLLRRRPGRAPRPPERAGHDARVRLTRPPGRDPGPEGADGLGAIPWYTITDDFDADFGVDEWHGHNAFIRDGDRIFRTYFIDARGDEALGHAPGATSTSPRSAARRSGRTRRRATRRRPPYGWWNYHDAYGKAA